MVAKRPLPTVLTGERVRLEPLRIDHLGDLFAAGGGDEEVWRWQPGRAPQTEAELEQVMRGVLDPSRGGVCFAVIDRQDGDRAVGWTGFWDISEADERVEIGWTWYARKVWRTAVNTESKLLLCTHAFEELGMGRVAWKTDHLNARSRAAIARLGAREEGTLRRHRRRADGTWRDTVYFSMLAEEWPKAKSRLTSRLQSPH
ncbi:GNAT family N-acetyltransferase [Mangrovactinospora gilvigrisea]|uniref:GNAT family N-acetyltransferase n=1 Tax=Mangrovactinospora gilvigrisea TaxID=1428644 RepID=A0A1J7C2X7_9ACTN|nr:GNAT family protein [Mangrovactinospora gilvigrisea]OIV35920.1 GNAT family N-acetyltransferase [Mangrovactinospora gilvigrisea]